MVTYHRILYSEITNFILTGNLENQYEKREEFISQILNNIDLIFDYTLKVYGNNSDEYRIVLKIYDHINLINMQYEDFHTPDEHIENIVNTGNAAINKNVERVKEELKNAEKGIYTQLISIVSLFVAIAFVMFGGVSLMNNIFDYSELEKIPLSSFCLTTKNA